MPYIYSTLPAGVIFDVATIEGGAGVANKRSLQTPKGVATFVEDDVYEVLKEIPSFQSYVKAGHFVVDRKDRNPDKVAKNMQEPKVEHGTQETPETIAKTSRAKLKK